MDAMDELLSENPEIEEEEDDEDDELLNNINNDDQATNNEVDNSDNAVDDDADEEDDDEEDDDEEDVDNVDDENEEEEDEEDEDDNDDDEDEVMDDADENIESESQPGNLKDDNMDIDIETNENDTSTKIENAGSEAIQTSALENDQDNTNLNGPDNKLDKDNLDTTPILSETSELPESTVDNEENDNSKNNQENKSNSPELEPLDKLHHYYLSMLQSAKLANSYNIYPTAAIPIQTNVNAITVSKGLKYLFLGGSDGYIRKFDLLNTLQGKLSLTILQKHFLTESISNAGILLSYWENEVPQYRSKIKTVNKNDYQPIVSPVYSLSVHDECNFLLSGLENGGITLQGARYMESKIGHYFKEHTQVVNLLRLNNSQDKFLSGSWDKRLLEWDLNTGDVINEFKGNKSELSSLEFRPISSSVVIEHKPFGTDDGSIDTNNINKEEDDDDEMDSLFGDDDDDDDLRNSIKQSSQSPKPELNAKPNSPTKSPQRDDDELKPVSKKMADEISSQTLNIVYDESVFMSSGLNGNIDIWDRRITNSPALTLTRGDGVPPWCFSATWSTNGDKIYAGRRNAWVEEFDLKMPAKPSNTLKLSSLSGPVTTVKAMPNGKHILIGSRDNIRLYDSTVTGSNIPFLIVPGHHGGTISNLYVDPTCRFMISTSGNRGWQGNATDTTLIYDIELE